MTSMHLYDGNVFSFWIKNHFGIFGGYKVNNDSSFNEKKYTFSNTVYSNDCISKSLKM